MENKRLLHRRLDELYLRLCETKDAEEAREVREEIDKLLVNAGLVTPYVVFISRMYKKPFCKTLEQLKRGEPVTDIELAKAISSSITHSLIDMEKDGSNRYNELYIPEQANVLQLFLLGQISKDDVRVFYSGLE